MPWAFLSDSSVTSKFCKYRLILNTTYLMICRPLLGPGGRFHRVSCMASQSGSDKLHITQPLDPFPSTYRDRPLPSTRFRPAPNTEDASVIDLTWFGSPLPIETQDFYNDGEEVEEVEDVEEAQTGHLEDQARSSLSLQDTALIYTSEGYTPDPFYGPLEVQRSSEGQGWSLTAYDVIEASTLVLISGPPLAFESMNSSDSSSGFSLRNSLLEKLGQAIQDKVRSQDPWTLRLLDPSKPLLRGSQRMDEAQSQGPSLDQFLKPVSSAREVKIDEKQSTPKRKYSSWFGKSLPRKSSAEIDYKKIALDNSFFGLHHDLASSSCRGEPLAPFTALWPEVSLIGHSCWPNASIVVVGTGLGSRAVIRSTRTILPGECITVSHIPTLNLLSPLFSRRDSISRGLGFICSCDRCKVEESATQSFSSSLQEIHEAAVSIRQQLAATLNDPKSCYHDAEGSIETMSEEEITLKACELVLEDSVSLLQIFKDEMSQLNEGPLKGLCSWILAGAFPIYEMMATCSQRIGGFGCLDQVRALQESLECLEVARGSEIHTAVSAAIVKMMGSLNGTQHPSTSNALRQCISAHSLRYGALAGASIAQLSSASLSCFADALDSSSRIISTETRRRESEEGGDNGDEQENEDADDSDLHNDSWGIPIKRS